MKTGTGVLLYLGVGACFHAVFIGNAFNFYSASTWAMLLGWPVPLLAAAWAVMAVVFGARVALKKCGLLQEGGDVG